MKDNRKQTTLEVARYGGARVPLYQPHMSVISESPRVKDPEAVRAKLDETNCIEKEIYGQPVTSRSSLATHLHACQTTERARRRSAFGVGRRPTDSLNRLHRMTGSTPSTMPIARAPSQPPPRVNPDVTSLARPCWPLWTVWVTCVHTQLSRAVRFRAPEAVLEPAPNAWHQRLRVPLKLSSTAFLRAWLC